MKTKEVIILAGILATLGIGSYLSIKVIKQAIKIKNKEDIPRNY